MDADVLQASENEAYFGIEKVFRSNMRHVHIVNEEEKNKLPVKHKKDDDIPVLWDSLKNAICEFLICNCIRTIRGDGTKHRSMMINVSPYNLVQNRMQELVEEYVQGLCFALQQYDKYPIQQHLRQKNRA